MQKPKLVDNATPGLEFQDSSTSEALDGTILRAIFQNDNFGNLFKLVENAGYDLIDDDLSQVVKAARGLYNSTFTYNTSAIATQTVDDIVLGSDGNYYKVLSDGILDDDPVGSITGNWVQDSISISQTEFDIKLGDAGSSLTTNGYLKLSNGLIFQWGLDNNGLNDADTALVVTLPIAFPNAALVCSADRGGSANQNATSGCGTTAISLYATLTNSDIKWVAIGY